jgi:glutathione S-transferase
MLMKLYFSPGACSLAPHIVLREAGSTFTLEQVDLGSHKTQQGADYYLINPKGSVPVLELDNGERLTEGPVICQYIADQAKNLELMPAAGTMARYHVMEWQNFITSEIHKGYSPLFNPTTDAATKASFRTGLRKKYEFVNMRIGANQHLTGDAFTAADAYLFTVTRWAKPQQVDLTGLDSLSGFMTRVRERATVKAAIHAETGASHKA